MIERLIGRPLHYGWLIVVVTFVTLITTAGFRATPGVLIVPLQQEFGCVFGWIFAAHQIGAAAAAWAGGASRTWFGTYGYAFVSAGVLCLFAAGLSLRIGTPEGVAARRTARRPLSEPQLELSEA